MHENPWLGPLDGPPFVLTEDAAVVRDFNCHASEDHLLRVYSLLPEPFVGDPQAPVVLLGTNPGFSHDGANRKQDSGFRARLRANLRHETSEYPFVFFAPKVRQLLKPWWDRKLRQLLYLGHEVLARSILAVEHFPYPSRRYGAGRLRLPSQAYSFFLVRKAMERKAIIVLTRGKRWWLRDVPALEGYEGLCELRNPQAGSISTKNCQRFQEVVRAIEASQSGRERKLERP
jgi:hypothetical protein